MVEEGGEGRRGRNGRRRLDVARWRGSRASESPFRRPIDGGTASSIERHASSISTSRRRRLLLLRRVRRGEAGGTRDGTSQ